MIAVEVVVARRCSQSCRSAASVAVSGCGCWVRAAWRASARVASDASGQLGASLVVVAVRMASRAREERRGSPHTVETGPWRVQLPNGWEGRPWPAGEPARRVRRDSQVKGAA